MRRKVIRFTKAGSTTTAYRIATYGARWMQLALTSLADFNVAANIYGYALQPPAYVAELASAAIVYAGNIGLPAVSQVGHLYYRNRGDAQTQIVLFNTTRGPSYRPDYVVHNQTTWTIECTIYPLTVSGKQTLWTCFSSAGNVYQLSINAGTLLFEEQYSSGTVNQYFFQTVVANTPYHIVFSRTGAPGGNWNCYLNGSLSQHSNVLSTNPTLPPTGGTFLGGSSAGVSFGGYLGQIAFYFFALDGFTAFEHYSMQFANESPALIVSPTLTYTGGQGAGNWSGLFGPGATYALPPVVSVQLNGSTLITAELFGE